MDEMSDVSDPRVAVQVAQDHLEQARERGVELYKSLDGAYQLTAHLVSHSTST